MITVDPEYWDRFQKLFPGQASSFCSDAIMIKIKLLEGNTTGIDQRLLKLKEDELQKIVDDTIFELKNIRTELQIRETELKKNEENALILEKNRLESLKKCFGCSNMFLPNEKTLEVKGKFFCKACFMTDNPKITEELKQKK
jgi:hypothetical protein